MRLLGSCRSAPGVSSGHSYKAQIDPAAPVASQLAPNGDLGDGASSGELSRNPGSKSPRGRFWQVATGQPRLGLSPGPNLGTGLILTPVTSCYGVLHEISRGRRPRYRVEEPPRTSGNPRSATGFFMKFRGRNAHHNRPGGLSHPALARIGCPTIYFAFSRSACNGCPHSLASGAALHAVSKRCSASLNCPCRCATMPNSNCAA